jgi:hypothetical protein
LKAFGDLVILRAVLESAGVEASVLLGSHLVELFDALGPFWGERFVIESDGVPALFDIKRQGIARAMRSAQRLRDQIAELNDRNESILVFDRLAWRERLISNARSSVGLPRAPNIYLAYRQIAEPVSRPFLSSRHIGRVRHVGRHSVGIFPASRVPRKEVPIAVIDEVVRASLRLGLDPSLHLLVDERPDLDGVAAKIERIPRTFSALAASVQSVDMIVSADSLPAHLAEFFGIPVFVLSPLANEYWLPLSAYQKRRWSPFDSSGMNETRLEAFLTSASVL